MTTSIDPVCRMPTQDSPTALRLTYREHTYLFCSGQCRDAFEADPQRYLQNQTAPGA